MTRARDCSTCRSERYCESEGDACQTAELRFYRPRPFWTEAERAGLKAMGKTWLEEKFCGCGAAPIAIRAYVKAAKEAKREK